MNIIEIRNYFLENSIRWGHININSFPVKSEKTDLIFNNSGMSPLRENFFNVRNLQSPLSNIQKCVRLGGKHNDFNNIGVSKQHLTFFEMLGNFSFNNYNREYAFEYIWNFISYLNLKKNNLLITIHSCDIQSELLWKKISGLNDYQIIKTYGNQNIWNVGDSGLCGLCSEIYYINKSEYWEILNLVLIEYELILGLGLKKLSIQSIDIGIGLERLASILQKTFDVYYINTFLSIKNDIIKNKYLSICYKIIFDHIRCCCFIIIENIIPSNWGAGYILRKLIRKCIVEIKKNNLSVDLIYDVVESIVIHMNYIDNLILKYKKIIINIINSEIKLCDFTIKRNLKIINKSNNLSNVYKIYNIPDKLLNNIKKISNNITYKLLYFKKEKNEIFNINFININYLSSRIIYICNNYLYLLKTNISSSQNNQISNIGLILSLNFSLKIINVTKKNENLCNFYRTLFKTKDNIFDSKVYMIFNKYVGYLISFNHTLLHLFYSFINYNIIKFKTIKFKINYLNLYLQLNLNNNYNDLFDNLFKNYIYNIVFSKLKFNFNYIKKSNLKFNYLCKKIIVFDSYINFYLSVLCDDIHINYIKYIYNIDISIRNKLDSKYIIIRPVSFILNKKLDKNNYLKLNLKFKDKVYLDFIFNKQLLISLINNQNIFNLRKKKLIFLNIKKFILVFISLLENLILISSNINIKFLCINLINRLFLKGNVNNFSVQFKSFNVKIVYELLYYIRSILIFKIKNE